MALTEIPIELSSTPSIVDGGNATAITIDSSISCPVSCDGAVSVSPTNGVAPILYTMTGYSPQTSQSWTAMCGDITFPSQYTLDAIDGNGCTASTNIINPSLSYR